MSSLRAGANLIFACKRGGHQLVRRSYAKAAPPRRSNILLYASLAGVGLGLHTYSPNNVYCDSTANLSL